MKSRGPTYSPLWWGGIAAILGIIGIVGCLTWIAHTAAAQAAQRNAANLVELINAEIFRNIEMHDQAMLGLAALEKSRAFADLQPKALHAIKFGQLVTGRALGAMLVLDARGEVVADSTSVIPREGNFAHREFFQIHRGRSGDSLYVGYLMQPRFEDQQPRLILSRRISDTAGNFQGVVVTGIRLAYVEKLLENLKIDPDSTISLMHADGTLLARRGAVGEPVQVGQNFSAMPNFATLMRSSAGTFGGRSQIDGIERQYVFSRVFDYPLVVVVGLALPEVFRAWWQSTIMIGVATLAICLAIAGWLLRINRELQDRRTHLAGANILARTDGLTQLPNRRYFEERLHAEKSLPFSETEPLSVLVIDVDRFKSINDRFGHPVGDRMLQSLARVIRANLDGHRFFCARYGGEEFAVLLPGRSPRDCRELAESIRRQIESMTDKPAEVTVCTVSIGLASSRSAGENASELMARADAALYQAKANGRNRVAVAC